MSRYPAVVLLLMVLCLKQGYADFDIRNVDFLNFTYHPTLCNAEEGIGETVRVRRGEWNGKDSYYHVSKVSYGDLTGDGRDDAAVAISCGPKAANFSESEIHIYSAHEKHASLIAQVDDSGLEREYKLYNTDCIESDDNPSCGVWPGVRNLEIIGGQLVVESLAEGYHARPKYVVKFTYQVQDGRLVLAQKPQKPTASEDATYFDDFSRYTPGSPPSGWLLRGAAEVTPTIMEVGGVGPSYRVLDFPEVRRQLWDKWVLKEGLIPRAPYTITVRLNFRKRVADRAGLTIAWNDANWDRIDIQPNVYWGGIEMRILYTGPVQSTPVVSDVGHIPFIEFRDYWLRVVVKDDKPGQGRLSVFLSSDGAHFKRVVSATRLEDVRGLVGIGTAGPNLPHAYFDDFSVVSGAASEETFVDNIISALTMAKTNIVKAVRAEWPAIQKTVGAEWRTYLLALLLVLLLCALMGFIVFIRWAIKAERERQRLLRELVTASKELTKGSEEMGETTDTAEKGDLR